ncbi:TPA: erythromycin resistance leader peptide, partial [Staphylococcus aureus]|nr:erythromycin resistance leader peptide [Staphylococcus aureus]HDM4547405.1 erythromycin resistance leader peptide [Staphylococcus aureus]HDM4550140.1 erythromycin resistance leader peptide [Staphylococcus aureus]HDM4553063.1 erythromycin resistance leader peptide [Staphylococcus aureus]HDM4644118.1 erythromycin resistance leader peptide [Staphylococcus aureus]
MGIFSIFVISTVHYQPNKKVDHDNFQVLNKDI